MTELLTDGCMDFLGGQDASKIPDRAPENAYYAGINLSVKRGAIQQRWAFDKKGLSFEVLNFEDDLRRIRSLKQVFEGGKFQAVVPYRIGTVPYLVMVVAGHIFFVRETDWYVQYLEIKDHSLLDSKASRINWTAAEGRIILFDFPAFPVIIDGLSAKRADPSKYEVPVSVMGAYNQSRLFIANAGSEFTGGDVVGNLAASNPPISFEEVEKPGSSYYGQIFALSTNHWGGHISAMGFLQQTDTSTGIGTLLLATPQAIWAYGASAPRSSWEAGQFGAIIVNAAGIVGPRAMVNVNSDAFFMSADKHIRSLMMSRQEQGAWARVPMSREVENWLVCHETDLLRFSFAEYFKNKLFFSVNPYRVLVEDFQTKLPISDYAFGGLVVMELDNFVEGGRAAKPTWAGLWTGIRPMDMCSHKDDIDERCFIVAKDGGINTIWEVDPDLEYDQADNKIRYIHSRVYTREHDFKDPFLDKAIHGFDMNLDNLQGDVKVDVKYKASHSPYFTTWGTFKYPAPWRTKQVPSAALINGFAHHMIRDLSLGSPPITCNPATKEINNQFRKVQLQLDFWAKKFELHEYRAKAKPTVTSQNVTTCNYEKVPLPMIFNDDWCLEDFGVCQET